MAWQPIRFRQDGYVRLFPLVKSGIVVVAKRSGRHRFYENQVDNLVLRIDKNVTDFPRRNIGFNSGLLRKFESPPRKEELGRKWPEVDSGSSKASDPSRRSSRRFVSLFLFVKIRAWYSAVPPFQRLRSNFPAPYTLLIK